jgi:hypothetical protein
LNELAKRCGNMIGAPNRLLFTHEKYTWTENARSKIPDPLGGTYDFSHRNFRERCYFPKAKRCSVTRITSDR